MVESLSFQPFLQLCVFVLYMHIAQVQYPVNCCDKLTRLHTKFYLQYELCCIVDNVGFCLYLHETVYSKY